MSTPFREEKTVCEKAVENPGKTTTIRFLACFFRVC